MKVLKPNGIIQALYVEFQLIIQNSRQHKKPARALVCFNFLNSFLNNIVSVCRVKFNNTIVGKEYRQQAKKLEI
jgi:hypothetical protein